MPYFALAPMAGYSDRAFRRLCISHGADFTVSEMICAKAMIYEQRSRKSAPAKTASLAAIGSDELDRNTLLQIFGSEPEYMAEAAKLLESGEYRGSTGGGRPIAIDINMGCPVRKVVANGEGSALMKDPILAGKIVSAVKAAVKIPVTVKFRLGFDSEHINAVEFAKIMEESGADAICLHARTREEMYAPKVHREYIAKVKSTVKIPVFGNGGVMTPEDARIMLDETHCDGIMIARGAMGNPWIFENVKALLEGKEIHIPDKREISDTILHQCDEMLSFVGERTTVAEIKKHIAAYIHGFDGSASLRQKIVNLRDINEIKSEIAAFGDQ